MGGPLRRRLHRAAVLQGGAAVPQARRALDPGVLRRGRRSDEDLEGVRRFLSEGFCRRSCYNISMNVELSNDAMAAVFRALGDPTRLRIFRTLRCCALEVAVDEAGQCRPTGSLSVGEVC